MATPFLGSEEYDERAHRLYNDGEYDRALDTLKEGLTRYPHSVDLYVGLGYTRLAREEFAWARQSFEMALVLDPDDVDALVGRGEVLLRLGRQAEAVESFERVRRAGCGDDLDLLLSMGRALYREQLYDHAHDVFNEAILLHPENAEALAALAYTLHRTGREGAARRELRRAIRLDPELYEARIYLGHILYDRGDWKGALRQFEGVPPSDQWDTLALWRLIELKRALAGLETGDPELGPWELRLESLNAAVDPVEELLAELEHAAAEQPPVPAMDVRRTSTREERIHRVRTPDGQVYTGSWLEIVRQMRDTDGRPGETIAQFMRRVAGDLEVRTGERLSSDDPEAFLRAAGRAGLLRIEC